MNPEIVPMEEQIENLYKILILQQESKQHELKIQSENFRVKRDYELYGKYPH